MTKKFDYVVYIGRFQPLHNGHLDVLRRAFAQAEKVIVVLGSARCSRNIKNPFSDDEREHVIRSSLGDSISRERLCVTRVRDYYDMPKWAAAIRRAVNAIAASGSKVGLIGHLKDASSAYLNEFPEWPIVHEENYAGLSAKDVRYIFFSSGIANSLRAAIPTSTLEFLTAFSKTDTYTSLVEEFKLLENYKHAWSSAPYLPIFSTVDAVVRADNHVLMVQRGGFPGKGQWALPGGFVEPNERLRDGAVRELQEETRIQVDRETLLASQIDRDVFDHPDRSTRGRTITNAFFFDLALAPPPSVTAADDATAARWVSTSWLLQNETQIFEDHLLIVNRFLHLFE
jgi:bifunctional NMN adenylyltransferase/nudix hydrolase